MHIIDIVYYHTFDIWLIS